MKTRNNKIAKASDPSPGSLTGENPEDGKPKSAWNMEQDAVFKDNRNTPHNKTNTKIAKAL